MTAAGGFDIVTWQSTGTDYSVEVSSDAPADQLVVGVQAAAGGEPDRVLGGELVDRVFLLHHVERSRVAALDRAHLLEVVDQVAEIPHAIRAGATVQRVI